MVQRMLGVVVMAGIGLASVGCASSGSVHREERQRLEAERDAAVAQERVATVVAQRDAATAAIEKEKELRVAGEAQIVRLEREIQKLTQEKDQLRARLADVDSSNIFECLEQVNGCQKEREQAKIAAFSQGMLAVWESLFISIVPRTEGSLWSEQHYISVNVRARNRLIYHGEFETVREEADATRSFSSLADLATIAGLFIK